MPPLSKINALRLVKDVMSTANSQMIEEIKQYVLSTMYQIA